MEFTPLLKRRFWLLWVAVCLTTCTLGGCFAVQAYGVPAGIFGMIFGSGLVCVIPNAEYCGTIPEKEPFQKDKEASNRGLE